MRMGGAFASLCTQSALTALLACGALNAKAGSHGAVEPVDSPLTANVLPNLVKPATGKRRRGA